MGEVVLTEDEKLYIKSMESWIREWDARIKEQETAKDTLVAILKENDLQLSISLKRKQIGIDEYYNWRKEKGLDQTEL